MHVVAIYNNKGGVGKSTLTIGLAEFLAGNLRKRVLIIDLDAQASATSAILDRGTIKQALAKKMTVVNLVSKIRSQKKLPQNWEDYLIVRPSTETRGSALKELAVLVPDRSKFCALEEKLTSKREATLLRDHLKPVLGDFDFVLIDLPSNADRRQKLIVNGLTMSDFVLIPTKSDQISLAAFPDTFDLVDHARSINKNARPSVIGIVRNMTDCRLQQYKAKFPTILEASASRDLPPIFENILPSRPALETASDGTRDVRTLRQRFANGYDPIRKVARELVKKCDEYVFRPGRKQLGYGDSFRGILDGYVKQ